MFFRKKALQRKLKNQKTEMDVFTVLAFGNYNEYGQVLLSPLFKTMR